MKLNCKNEGTGDEGFAAIEEMHYHPNFMCAHAICSDYNGILGTNDICKKKCVNIPNSVDICAAQEKDSYTCTYPGQGITIDSHQICDDICNCPSCDDEAICNGFTYGYFCYGKTNRSTGHHPNERSSPMRVWIHVVAFQICDGEQHCEDGGDENNCDEGPLCDAHSIVRPITNRTRCAPVRGDTTLYCDDYSDQLNCVDSSIANLTCLRGGDLVSVADRMICHNISGVQLCDDGFENMCVKIDITCDVHKHQLCDEDENCVNGADELHDTCQKMSKFMCKRVFGLENRLLHIPLSWINDGYKDCDNGEDEDKYPTCGLTPATKRLVTEDEECEEVFLCGFPPSDHIEFEDLCDHRNTCNNEKELCHTALSSSKIFQKLSNSESKLVVSYCLRGLESLAYMAGNCSEMECTYQNYEILGRIELILNVPETEYECNYVYGEMYVHLACIGQCADSLCPLKNPLRHDSCPGQYPSRIYTLTGSDSLSFLLPYGNNNYHNNLFPCENGRCIPYENVCNLADDCGDSSDESDCTNHFECKLNMEYIPKSSVCDGKPDCLDLSDECNDRCHVRIIENVALEVLAWILGSLATLFNSIALLCGIYNLRSVTPGTDLFKMKILILIIASGDLLLGVYLLAISIYHRVYHHSYCSKRFEWLTSTSCAVMGIVSTMGSLVSLFSMTVLSVTRSLKMMNLSVVEVRSFKSNIQILLIGITIVISSCLMTAAPLFKPFEDFFVNGIYYPGSSLFVGSVTKSKHLEIFGGYYGRLKNTDISWENIDKLAVGMFSEEYGGIHRHQVHFYGNAGVCLFKYFVTPDDPQRIYVWFILILNITCFTLITMSYIIIHIISTQSTGQVRNNNTSSRNTRLQRKIALIIGTNFCCWIPFIVMCLLHSLEMTDASPYYSIFSIVILPINSVINPLLYDDTISGLVYRIHTVLTGHIRSILPFSEDTAVREATAIQETSHVRSSRVRDQIPLQEMPVLDKQGIQIGEQTEETL